MSLEVKVDLNPNGLSQYNGAVKRSFEIIFKIKGKKKDPDGRKWIEDTNIIGCNIIGLNQDQAIKSFKSWISDKYEVWLDKVESKDSDKKDEKDSEKSDDKKSDDKKSDKEEKTNEDFNPLILSDKEEDNSLDHITEIFNKLVSNIERLEELQRYIEQYGQVSNSYFPPIIKQLVGFRDTISEEIQSQAKNVI